MARILGSLGSIVRVFSWAFLPPVLIALLYDEPTLRLGMFHIAHAVPTFLLCFLVSRMLATAMGARGARNALSQLRDSEAYLVVGLSWILLTLVGMLPFLVEGVLADPVDAFFETMSGMTTTGATVLQGDYEVIPKSIMVWRALLQFIGGMGIIVLSVAALARLASGGVPLLQAETPGTGVERIAPSLIGTARRLWAIYAGLGVALFVLTFVVLWHHHYGIKTTIYESLMVTLATVSTGGFGAHAESIAYYHDALLESVLIGFMLLSGMNFVLHYRALKGAPRVMVRDGEWRFFVASFVAVTMAIWGVLTWSGVSILGALRGSAFTVASLITSTGFGTDDFDTWPATAKLLILLIMVTGASAGSTGGGIKHIRVLLMFKLIRRHMIRLRHPRAVLPVKIGRNVVPDRMILSAAAFLACFAAAWLLAALILVAIDPAFHDPVDALSASVSALSNMGPGFGVVGPTQNYALLLPASKLLLAMEMWFGRLEIFAALLVFTPEAWRS